MLKNLALASAAALILSGCSQIGQLPTIPSVNVPMIAAPAASTSASSIASPVQTPIQTPVQAAVAAVTPAGHVPGQVIANGQLQLPGYANNLPLGYTVIAPSGQQVVLGTNMTATGQAGAWMAPHQVGSAAVAVPGLVSTSAPMPMVAASTTGVSTALPTAQVNVPLAATNTLLNGASTASNLLGGGMVGQLVIGALQGAINGAVTAVIEDALD